MRRTPFTRVGSGLALGLLCLIGACGTPEVKGTAGPPGATAGTGGGGGAGGFTLPPPGMGAPPAPSPSSAPPTEQMNCGLSRIPLYSKPGQLLLVLDRSGSMAQQVGPELPVEKWGQVVGALEAVLQRTEATIPWGLKLYPQGSLCGVPQALTVPLRLNNRADVMAAVNANRPYIDGGATPTRAAVLEAVASLKADAAAASMSPHLLIATDGIPNCTTMAAGNPPDAEGALDAIRQALAAGLPSFVVGIATAGTEADDTLNRMAEAGGRARNGPVKYYPVASRDELYAAFTSISGDVASCQFPLTAPPPAPDNVAVEVGGQRVAPGTGWTYGPNRASIILTGDACEAVKRGATDVKIIYGCPNQVIP